MVRLYLPCKKLRTSKGRTDRLLEAVEEAGGGALREAAVVVVVEARRAVVEEEAVVVAAVEVRDAEAAPELVVVLEVVAVEFSFDSRTFNAAAAAAIAGVRA